MKRGRPPMRTAPAGMPENGNGERHPGLEAPEGGAESPESGPAAVPDNFQYVGDELHVKVTSELKARANAMFEEARENPRSGAGTMVRILLLNAVANMHADRYTDARLVLSEERHRGDEARIRGEMAQHRVRQLKTLTKKNLAGLRLAELKVKELQQKIEERERKLAEALKAAESAKNALENGQPLDAMAVYNKIAEIVGLRAPAERERAASVQ